MSSKTLLQVLCAAVLLSVSAFAVDGVVLINQNTVMAAGGFPYKITQPGSYRLSGNLIIGDQVAIEINSSYVSLDLNGFAIVATCPQGASCSGQIGIHVNGPFNNVAIANGAIHGTAAGGIVAESGSIVSVERIKFTNGSHGVSLDQGSITRAQVDAVATAIACAAGCEVDSSYLSNAATGIVSGGYLRARDNTLVNCDVGMAAASGLVTHNIITTANAGNARFGLAIESGTPGHVAYGDNFISGYPNDQSPGILANGIRLPNNVCDSALCN